MLRYETLFITVPEITSDESAGVEKHLEKAVKEVKGDIVSYERWGKYHLAYPIRKYDYGVYYLMRFEVDDTRKDSVLKDLHTLFSVKLGDLVMRNTVVRLDSEGSLEYNRPESLEEVPSKDIDAIMKDSKNILGSKRGSRDRAPRETPREAAAKEPEAQPEKVVETVTETVKTEES